MFTKVGCSRIIHRGLAIQAIPNLGTGLSRFLITDQVNQPGLQVFLHLFGQVIAPLDLHGSYGIIHLEHRLMLLLPGPQDVEGVPVLVLVPRKNVCFVLVLNSQILLVFISFVFETKKLMALVLFQYLTVKYCQFLLVLFLIQKD